MRLNKEGMKRMKKFFPAFMAFLLVFSTVGPLPGIAETPAKTFPGTVEGSVVTSDNTGTVKVEINGGNAGWTITLQKLYGNNDQQAVIEDGGNTFTEVPAGLYFIRAIKEGLTKESEPIMVKPKPLTISTTDEPSDKNIISSIDKPYRIEIRNAIPFSTIKLYIKDSKGEVYRNISVSSSGNGVFDTVEKPMDARSNYYITQTVNGAESATSEAVTVYPDMPNIERLAHSGSSNNAGSILVKEIKIGNKLLLTSGGKPIGGEETATTNQFTFKGLAAGKYSVQQKENGVLSLPTKEIEVLNQQPPNIILNGDKDMELRYEIDSNDIVKYVKYEEKGYKVIDKNKNIFEGNGSASFCDNNEEKEQCTPLKMEVTSDIVNDLDRTIPGKYTVTYKATDGEFNNLSETVVRNVTVFPNKVNIYKEDTEYQQNIDFDKRKTGTITVKGVYGGATLKLYKRNTDGSISDVPSQVKKVTDGEYKFDNIKVGKGYFVVQSVDGLDSFSSSNINVEDNTPPELTIVNDKNLTIEVGDKYDEYGVTGLDNIDTPEELAKKVDISGDVDTEKPGTYTVTYTVEDKAGNPSEPVKRFVTVKPRPVIAIGSTALIGEIGVKNIFAHKDMENTILNLYKANEDGTFPLSPSLSYPMLSKDGSYVFENYGPGSYYVTQTVNSQESRQSNVVEIVDVDKPYITINGPENISLTLDSKLDPYFTSDNIFKDLGAIADDYLLHKDKTITLTATVTGPNAELTQDNEIIQLDEHFNFSNKGTGTSIEFPQFKIKDPGLYKIKYTATAKRLAVAVPKYRKLTVAPPKTTNTKHEGKGVITSDINSYTKSTTTAKLYNSYNQLVDTDTETPNGKATFKNVPNGIGYYVTQTVNGIESQPSLPVNVSIFETPLSITSFKFKEVDSFSVINHKDSTILVSVPKGTITSKLTPVTTVIGTISSNCKGVQDFSGKNPVDCTVESDPVQNPKKTKVYKVTVKEAAGVNEIPTPNTKEISISDTNSSHSLTSKEKREASENGINFLMNDKKNSIYVPASNVIEAENPMLTVSGTTTDKLTVKWGNLSRFMQPLEMKLEIPSNNSLNKSFAKIVDGYEIMLPSTSNTTAKTVTGLVNEPGTYALVSNINTPVFKDNKFSVATGTVYYTTSSKDITFISSARDKTDSINKRYVTTASPTEILKWTKYKEGDIIPSTVTELYAVSVNGNKISEIYSHKSPSSIDWSKNVPTYETHKVLAINFNARVDREALYSELIFVTDDATNKTVPTNLEMSNDGKTIYVVPQQAYTRGKQYTLHIERQFKGNTKNKEFLKKSLLQTFKIE